MHSTFDVCNNAVLDGSNVNFFRIAVIEASLCRMLSQPSRKTVKWVDGIVLWYEPLVLDERFV